MARRTFTSLLGGTLLLVIATAAGAQQADQTPSGKLIVEQIQNGWLFSPDVRATDLDGKAGALAGGYLGHITDRTWVFGAGGYFLTNREDDFRLAYGGPVVEWLVRTDRKVGFGIRALVGAGTATLSRSVADLVDPRVRQSSSSNRRTRSDSRLIDPDARVAVNDDFFIAEPQLNLLWNLSQGQRIVFGVGYRAVGNAPLLGDQLKGVSGSISVQFGGK